MLHSKKTKDVQNIAKLALVQFVNLAKQHPRTFANGDDSSIVPLPRVRRDAVERVHRFAFGFRVKGGERKFVVKRNQAKDCISSKY